MGRRGVTAVVAALAGLGVVAPVGAPGGAQTLPPGPVWLVVDSDPGDDIGGGVDRSYTPSDADFRVYTYAREVQVVVAGAETWRIGLVRPSDEPQLEVGRYEAVPRADRGPDDGGLSISAEGRGCGDDDTSGWFEIDDVAYSGGVVTRLAARFEHTCAPDEAPGTGGTLRGEVRWDGSEPQPTNYIPPSPVPPTFPSAPAGHMPANSNAMWLARPQAELPDGSPFAVVAPLGEARIFPIGDASQVVADGHFPVQGITLVVKMRHVMSTRQPAYAPGLYEDLLAARDNPVLGGFETSPGVGGTCADGTGGADVVVDEVDLGPDETTFDDLRVRWLTTCAGRVVEQGEVRYQWPAPNGAPAAPTAVSAAAGSASTVVSWTPPASGPTPTGYVVTTFVDGLARETSATAGAGATSVVVPTPDPGIHTFKVAAVGSAGTGRRSVASEPVAVPGPDLGPFASISAFVRQQHLDLAGRQPTRAELQTVARALAGGEVTPQEVVRDLRSRARLSARRAAITRLYRASFGRPPDTEGLTYWVQRVADGTSMSRVAQSFAASAEHRRLYGSLSDDAFVQRTYENVLGRAPDTAGHEFWVGRLRAGWSRGRVLLSFGLSAEHTLLSAGLVETVTTYVAMVGRVPSAGELPGSPTGRTPTGASSAASAELVRGLLGSTEYAARFG
ncbi:DUF4214 domain-containing protein [Iamia sp. SCSIO 61187]|uniref:DUF4214 domain-containing protein n=1 Tax=Iamia sp. SCSIO 61187 TaxID=2722752 RepID=UPI001C62DA47|nr:DUF4214 domain-containing protein [Iamia sp. SCSIO 61187]QYG92475.1 DUF4214 domain-containing protein [Iamia sp. SCSIO 61187]